MTSKNFFLVVFSCEIVALLDVAGQEYTFRTMWGTFAQNWHKAWINAYKHVQEIHFFCYFCYEK